MSVSFPTNRPTRHHPTGFNSDVGLNRYGINQYTSGDEEEEEVAEIVSQPHREEQDIYKNPIFRWLRAQIQEGKDVFLYANERANRYPEENAEFIGRFAAVRNQIFELDTGARVLFVMMNARGMITYVTKPGEAAEEYGEVFLKCDGVTKYPTPYY